MTELPELRRLVAAAAVARHWLEVFMPNTPAPGLELESALAAVRLAELERVVEALRGIQHLGPMLSCDNGVHAPNGASEGAHWLGQALQEVDESLAALDAPAKENT